MSWGLVVSRRLAVLVQPWPLNLCPGITHLLGRVLLFLQKMRGWRMSVSHGQCYQFSVNNSLWLKPPGTCSLLNSSWLTYTWILGRLSVRVNFMGHILWIRGFPAIWLNIISGCICEVANLEDIRIWIGRLSKADCPPQCRWVSSNSLRDWIKQNGGGFSLSFSLFLSPWLTELKHWSSSAVSTQALQLLNYIPRLSGSLAYTQQVMELLTSIITLMP